MAAETTGRGVLVGGALCVMFGLLVALMNRKLGNFMALLFGRETAGSLGYSTTKHGHYPAVIAVGSVIAILGLVAAWFGWREL